MESEEWGIKRNKKYLNNYRKGWINFMKFKKLIAAGLTAAMFMTAGVAVSAAGSAKVTRTANVGYSQGSNFDDFEVDHLY